ncbi:MAG: hypothetical protein ACRCZP_17680 [Phycicoccus sp.]
MPLFATVAAEPAGAPQSGLLHTARTRPAESGWELGLAWRPERCFDSDGFPLCGDTPDGAATTGGAADAGPVYHRPVALRIRDVCAASAGPLDPERARRQAEAATSFHAARELWTGDLSDADPFHAPEDDPAVAPTRVNARLSAATATVVAGVHEPAAALARLEQAARQAAHGQDVWLHTPVAVANLASAGGMLTSSAGVLRTPVGAVVVADAGYPGSGPGDVAPAVNRAWVYATGPVQVRLGPIMQTTDPAVTLNRQVNRWEHTVFRPFAATFDPCLLLAIQVALPTPA